MEKITYNQYCEAKAIIKKYTEQLENEYKDMYDKYIESKKELKEIPKYTKATETSLLAEVTTVRTLNVLKAKSNEIFKSIDFAKVDISDLQVKDLQGIKIYELLKYRNCGKNTINEIINICNTSGVLINKEY